jgi:hypothetical protein
LHDERDDVEIGFKECLKTLEDDAGKLSLARAERME